MKQAVKKKEVIKKPSISSIKEKRVPLRPNYYPKKIVNAQSLPEVESKRKIY